MWGRRSLLVGAGLLITSMGPLPGETELVLVDGRVLQGTELRRDDEVYVLTQSDGSEVALPRELVETVRLILRAEPGSKPPAPDELAVFGEPARFQRDIVDAAGMPESDWDLDPERDNNFAPSTWQKNIVDPVWQPQSAFDTGKDVLKDSRSTWQRNIVDSEWQPTDGFKDSPSRK